MSEIFFYSDNQFYNFMLTIETPMRINPIYIASLLHARLRATHLLYRHVFNGSLSRESFNST